MIGERVYIKPCEGRTVINPATGLALAQEGEWLTLSVHLLRCIKFGDCEAVPQPLLKDQSASYENTEVTQ